MLYIMGAQNISDIKTYIFTVVYLQVSLQS